MISWMTAQHFHLNAVKKYSHCHLKNCSCHRALRLSGGFLEDHTIKASTETRAQWRLQSLNDSVNDHLIPTDHMLAHPPCSPKMQARCLCRMWWSPRAVTAMPTHWPCYAGSQPRPTDQESVAFNLLTRSIIEACITYHIGTKTAAVCLQAMVKSPSLWSTLHLLGIKGVTNSWTPVVAHVSRGDQDWAALAIHISITKFVCKVLKSFSITSS